MYQLVVHDGATLTAAAQELNQAGLPAPAGAPWIVGGPRAVDAARTDRSEPHQAPGDSTGFAAPHPAHPRPPPPPRGGPRTLTAAGHPRKTPALQPPPAALLPPGAHCTAAPPALSQRPTYSCRAPTVAQGHPVGTEGSCTVPCDTVDDAVKTHLRQVLTEPAAFLPKPHTNVSTPQAQAAWTPWWGDPSPTAVGRVDADLAAEARLFRAQASTGMPGRVLGPLHGTPQDPATRHRPRRRPTRTPGHTTHAVQGKLTTALAAGLHTATAQTWRNL